ncbi:putative Ig domain-containing protein [Singulisphaera sp. PoT]|uniref:PQQ-dependent sugar dehydrogenase n=1 Tax=Singulisphaera sp. PoT TaxID=3411797 RepID=UPI003BF57981
MASSTRSIGGASRARKSRRGSGRRFFLEALEDRALLATGPFPVGGDPVVNPADFRVTTFASGLNYPHGMMSLSDGSVLVGVNNPNNGGSSFFDSTGELLRFTDADGDGVADGPGTSLYNGLVGEVTAVHQAGNYILATSSLAGSERITFLRVGATPADPLTLAGSIDFGFPSNWEHTTFASAVRAVPGNPFDYDVFFNIGSEFNGVVIGSDGKVVLDSSGNPTYTPTVDTVSASGLISGTLNGDSIYKVTLHDIGGGPALTGLTQIATGLRNAASLTIDQATGDLWIADNGIDGNDGGNAAWSTDELNMIPAAQIGGAVENFGFPYSYTKTIDKPGDPVTVVNPGPNVIQPIVAYQPLPDSALGSDGSQSEGASGLALSPALFPAGLNQGVFVGFHGYFNSGGVDNPENPFVFADPSTGHYFDFISNEAPNIGHLDEAMSTADSLFIADISSTGDIFGSTGPGMGVIYQIKAINHAPSIASIPNQSVQRGKTLTVQVAGSDPDTTQSLTYSLGANAPAGATIDPSTGVFTWTPDASTTLGDHSITVDVTDNGIPAQGASRTFIVTVQQAAPVNHPPVITPIPDQSIQRGMLLTFQVQASDPDLGQTLKYSLGAGAPLGARIDANTGVFLWRPSNAQSLGANPITVIVTDNGNPVQTASRTFNVTVVGQGPVNNAPVIASIPNQSVEQGKTLSLSIAGYTTDVDTPPQTIRYSLGSNAPVTARIDANTGLFTWTPAANQAIGSYSITVNATDNGTPAKTGQQTFVVNVIAASQPPVVNSMKAHSTFRGLNITLTFSEPLDAATANDASNYQLRGQAGIPGSGLATTGLSR